MLRKRLGEHCAEREVGEHCAERELMGTLCWEIDGGNTVMRDRFGKHCAEREIGGSLG